jgi:uncharacterized membrane protein
MLLLGPIHRGFAIVKQKSNPLKTTLIGGVMFLIPFVLILALAGKVSELMHGLAGPIANAIGVERFGGFAVLNLVTILLTFMICYAAGLAATSRVGKQVYLKVDEQLLNLFPRYGFLKATAGSMSGDTEKPLPVVIVRLDDQSMLCFEIERSDEQVVVFMPGSPDPWSGAVALVTPDRVTRMQTDFHKAIKSIRLAGRGMLDLPQ